ncbi:MAG: SpoIIE family protein phosphatase [Deltaproteobacteria bacterium]|nr:SpoIIE family protein phosphatase [Deltaproteobacteria bacterium]
MNETLSDILSELIQNLSFLMVLAYLLTRIPSFGDLVNRRFSLKNRLLLGFFFGLVSIYGTLSAVEIFGALAHFRDLGPAIAGLLAGPVAGGIAGLMGGVHRYSLGGVTCLPCSVATFAAGLIGGGYHLWKRSRPIRIWEAALLMAVITVIHIYVITPVLIGFSEEIQVILRTALIPMILVNGAGIAVFFFIIQNLYRERRNEAEKHRIDSELHIAREIQMGMLPAPAVTDNPRYAVHAVMKPAKEVGGDLYNFFALDEDRLCLAIGDVAGKGVSASLHMAITQKLLKALARADEGPAALLGRLNRELCEGNETMTFVTFFVAFCNVRKGETVFSNGGHNPPYLIKGGDVSRLVLEPGLALGIREQAIYTDQQLRLAPGDALFLYTDGVTEAMNGRNELYTDERLKTGLARLHALAPEAMCRGIIEDLGRFVGQSEQSDDITMIALRLNK